MWRGGFLCLHLGWAQSVPARRYPGQALPPLEELALQLVKVAARRAYYGELPLRGVQGRIAGGQHLRLADHRGDGAGGGRGLLCPQSKKRND